VGAARARRVQQRQHELAHDEGMTLNDDTTASLPEADPKHTFADLGVIEPIVEALAEVGITHPFPIQSLSIPIAIAGTDMIGQA
jgi:superfamily II DNA/RNA helicase